MPRRSRLNSQRELSVQLLTFIVGICLSIGLALAFWPANLTFQLPWPPEVSTLLAVVDFLTLIAILLVYVYRRSDQLALAKSALIKQEQEVERGARHVAELRILTKFARLSQNDVTPAEALPQLLSDIPGLVGAERSVLFLPDGNPRDICRTAEYGTQNTSVTSSLLGFEDALAQHVIDTKKPILVPPATDPQLITIDAPRPLSPQMSWVAIPVSTCDGTGAVVLTSMGKRPLVESNMEFLELILGTLTRTFDRASRLLELEKVTTSLRSQHEKVCEERGRVVASARAAASEKTLTELRNRLSTPVSDSLALLPKLKEYFSSGTAAEKLDALAVQVREIALVLESHVPESRQSRADPKTDIDSLVKGIVALHAERLRKQNIDTRLELSCGGSGPGDNQGRLHQTFEELLSQCIHRLQYIQAPRWLAIRSLRTAGHLRVVFWDNGKPLGMSELATLLIPQKGHASQGIQVAAALVSELGGDFRAQNPASGGFEQIVEIPLDALERPRTLATARG